MKFNCQCGKLSGEIDHPEELQGLRAICMCKDCQKYARFLGNAESILDKNGGSEIVPVFPKLFRITSGFEYVKGVKLTKNTGTFRWYASCCRSPLANSLSSKQGYVGLITQRLSLEDRNSLGPIRVRANGESGISPLPEGTSKKFPIKWLPVIIRAIVRIHLKGWKRPHPFFDENDRPYVQPEVLD